ncbi:hypothetical protein Tco_0920434 [Tanacetum coccineum]
MMSEPRERPMHSIIQETCIKHRSIARSKRLLRIEASVRMQKSGEEADSRTTKETEPQGKDIFAWEPSDMTSVPRRIIKHTLNANPSVTPISHKRKSNSDKRSSRVAQGWHS